MPHTVKSSVHYVVTVTLSGKDVELHFYLDTVTKQAIAALGQYLIDNKAQIKTDLDSVSPGGSL